MKKAYYTNYWRESEQRVRCNMQKITLVNTALQNCDKPFTARISCHFQFKNVLDFSHGHGMPKKHHPLIAILYPSKSHCAQISIWPLLIKSLHGPILFLKEMCKLGQTVLCFILLPQWEQCLNTLKKCKRFDMYRETHKAHYHKGRPMNCKRTLMVLGKEWKQIMLVCHVLATING